MRPHHPEPLRLQRQGRLCHQQLSSLFLLLDPGVLLRSGVCGPLPAGSWTRRVLMEEEAAGWIRCAAPSASFARGLFWVNTLNRRFWSPTCDLRACRTFTELVLIPVWTRLQSDAVAHGTYARSELELFLFCRCSGGLHFAFIIAYNNRVVEVK